MALSLRGWTRNVAALGSLWVGVGALPSAADWNPCALPPRPARFLEASVRRVIDGDTVLVRLANGRGERVRLIGIDAPEVHESPKLAREIALTGRDLATIQRRGRDAAALTAVLLPISGRIGLELDIEPRDRQGRLLAYVWRDDGVLVNLALLEAGHARPLAIPPNVRYADHFRVCAVAARGARRDLRAAPDRWDR
jgi:micrococcal nuclease